MSGGRITKILGCTLRMIDFVILVHRVHLNVLEVKTSLGLLNYPTSDTMLKYHEQTMISGTR